MLGDVTTPPEAGTVKWVAEGVGWLRLPLPFALDHINLWLLADGEGWAVVDTGVGDQRTKDLWEILLAGPLGGRPLTRVICTHFHPDHMGLADWLCRRFGIPLTATQSEWLFGRLLALDTSEAYVDHQVAHYRAAGFADDYLERVKAAGNTYRSRVDGVPAGIERIQDGDRLIIGACTWQVVVGYGHSPEHAALWCPESNLVIIGDQVLPRISPVVGAWPQDPHGDPLRPFFATLDRLMALVPADALILPAHGRPFRDLPGRCAELKAHHAERLAETLAACAEPATAYQVLKTLFTRPLDDHQHAFATAEALAHLNHLVAEGVLARVTDADGCWRFRAL